MQAKDIGKFMGSTEKPKVKIEWLFDNEVYHNLVECGKIDVEDYDYYYQDFILQFNLPLVIELPAHLTDADSNTDYFKDEIFAFIFNKYGFEVLNIELIRTHT
jgi:hypothetical protein